MVAGAQQQVVFLEEFQRARGHGDALRFGALELLDRQLEAFLDVPDHLGLEQVALGAQQRRLVKREVERAQHVEAFMGLAQIGMGFLDDGAGLGKTLRGLAGDGGDFRIDRRDAEIGRIGDALRLAAGARGGEERMSAAPAATADRPGCSPLMASSSRARSSTLRAIGPWTPRLRSTAAASVCATRPMLGRMPTMPQKLAGLRKRAAHVGAVRQPRRAGGERHRRAARGAGGGARRVPGIARRAEHFVEGVGAGAEFRRVRLGVDHAAIVFEMLDQDIRLRRDVILVDRRALRGQHARDIGQVLDRDRQPGEQAALGRPASSSAPWRACGRGRSTASAAR